MMEAQRRNASFSSDSQGLERQLGGQAGWRDGAVIGHRGVVLPEVCCCGGDVVRSDAEQALPIFGADRIGYGKQVSPECDIAGFHWADGHAVALGCGDDSGLDVVVGPGHRQIAELVEDGESAAWVRVVKGVEQEASLLVVVGAADAIGPPFRRISSYR